MGVVIAAKGGMFVALGFYFRGIPGLTAFKFQAIETGQRQSHRMYITETSFFKPFMPGSKPVRPYPDGGSTVSGAACP